MTCDHFRARYMAGERSVTLDSHLAGCAGCRIERSGLDRLRAALAEPTTWEVPGPDMEGLVVAEIRRQQRPMAARRPGRRLIAAAAAVAVVVVGGVAMALAPRSAPDWTTELVATSSAPDATATVDGWLNAEGTRMRFEVGGLEPSGPDAYYEIWLTAADGTHVSAGSFHTSGVIETSIGVARADYPRIWITLEQTDDDLGPSYITVLDDPSA